MLLAAQLKRCFSLSASFTVLGLKTTSKMDEVKRKYFELAKKYHPDVNTTDKNASNKFA
jgi:curved DNA-binding protein CbpA